MLPEHLWAGGDSSKLGGLCFGFIIWGGVENEGPHHSSPGLGTCRQPLGREHRRTRGGSAFVKPLSQLARHSHPVHPPQQSPRSLGANKPLKGMILLKAAPGGQGTVAPMGVTSAPCLVSPQGLRRRPLVPWLPTCYGAAPNRCTPHTHPLGNSPGCTAPACVPTVSSSPAGGARCGAAPRPGPQPHSSPGGAGLIGFGELKVLSQWLHACEEIPLLRPRHRHLTRPGDTAPAGQRGTTGGCARHGTPCATPCASRAPPVPSCASLCHPVCIPWYPL